MHFLQTRRCEDFYLRELSQSSQIVQPINNFLRATLLIAMWSFHAIKSQLMAFSFSQLVFFSQSQSHKFEDDGFFGEVQSEAPSIIFFFVN
jgi:hypothetical protein